MLIEKEWLSFAHQFREYAYKNLYERSNSAEHHDARTIHPSGLSLTLVDNTMFFLFLDCLHQVMEQHPEKFEFNQKLLMFLSREVWSSAPLTHFVDDPAGLFVSFRKLHPLLR